MVEIFWWVEVLWMQIQVVYSFVCFFGIGGDIFFFNNLFDNKVYDLCREGWYGDDELIDVFLVF